MNARTTLSIPLIVAIATCAACDRRETTGTSEVNREGQGETAETAQDLRETATPPPDTEAPMNDRSIEMTGTPPVDNPPAAHETKMQDATTQEERGDTLERP